MPQTEKLEQTNQLLQESLRTCHELVAEYRAKLAANGNERLLLDESTAITTTPPPSANRSA